jgi:hypothetical protein
MSQTISDKQIIHELAIQLFMNRDRIMDLSKQSGSAEFPDPNRQWRVYRDEWFTITETEKQQWFDAARTWVDTWKEKHKESYDLLLLNGKPVYSIM